MIKLNGLVLVYDNYILKHFKKTGIATELYHGNSDNEIRGASLRINRSGQRIKRSIKKLYPLKVTEENKNMENEMKNMNSRSRREAAILGEVKRHYGHS